MTLSKIQLVSLVALVTACSAAPEDGPEYEDTGSGSSDTGDGPDINFYQGSEPFTEGMERLSIGIFYEGEASQTIEIDDLTSHYYIYSDESSGQVTYETYQDTTDRVEGYLSDVLVHSGGGWWGGGVHWDTPQDISAWTHLNLSVKSSDSGFSSTEVAIQSQGASFSEGKVRLSTYGFVADSEWHRLQIPMADLAIDGLDLTAVIAPLILVAEGGNSGAELRIDELYFSAATDSE